MRAPHSATTIVGDAVYAMAGFGRQTHCSRTIQAETQGRSHPAGRSFSGIAEEVTERGERLTASLPASAAQHGRGRPGPPAMGMGNVWQMTPEAISAKFDGLPLVRVRATGIAAGPEDRAAGSGSCPSCSRAGGWCDGCGGRGQARKARRADR